MIPAVPVLQPSLTDESHSRIHFPNWKKQSFGRAAQGMCRTIDDCSTYSQVADDAEWSSYPSNIISTTVAGTTTIHHYPPPAPFSPNPLSTAPLNRKRWSSTCSTTTNYNGKNGPQPVWRCLHQAMINSIGALNLATIEGLSGHAGILSLSCRELLGHITVMFGSLHAGDVFYIH